MSVRKIVEIDESKCNGCGECIPNCMEGALQIIDGKARLLSDYFCDGLGACLGHCPMDAITVEEREAEEYSEKKVMEKKMMNGCPGSREQNIQRGEAMDSGSELTQWPIQMHLVSPHAPFLNNSHLLIAASCSAFTLGGFHSQLLHGKKLIIACPKLDRTEGYLEKLVEIFKTNTIKSVTVAIMEVPCCGGLQRLVEEAIAQSGKNIPLITETISIQGEIL